jgi:hypothetical protein
VIYETFFAACFSAKEFSYNVNPFALGSRWLAYADKKVNTSTHIYIWRVLGELVLLIFVLVYITYECA